MSWTKPADDGGSPVIGYLLEVSTKPPVITVNTHAVITGLKAGTQYTVKVYPQNIVGYGQAFIGLITTTKAGKLPVPKLVAVLNHTSALSVTLRWEKQDADIDQVVKYSVYKKDAFQSNWTKVEDVYSAQLVPEFRISENVEYGKTYQFIVTTWNRYGESEKNEWNAVTINIPIYDQYATRIGQQSPSSDGKKNSETESIHNPAAIGVLTTIALLSLGLNLLQYLLIWRKMKHFRADNAEEKNSNRTKAQTPASDQVYDNVLEMTDKLPPSFPGQSDSTGSPNQVIPAQAIEQTMGDPLKNGASGEPRRQSLSQQDKAIPVYEPLKIGSQNDNTYQPLGHRNTAYQSLNARANDSVV